MALFHKHFLLYRRLWLFDDELRAATGQRLWIRSILTTLLDAPPPGRCGWLDVGTGRYCLQPCLEGLCSHHSAAMPERNGMKSYYLDDGPLETMTEESAKELVEGFYRWWGNRAAVESALATLGLPVDADSAAAKERWRKLSLEHHPDRGGDVALFQKFSAAWTALKLKL